MRRSLTFLIAGVAMFVARERVEGDTCPERDRDLRGKCPPAPKPTPPPVTPLPPTPSAPKVRCPEGMVHVPAGTFQMGSPKAIGAEDEQPQHAVTISAFCVDKTEVTVGAYLACASRKCTAIKKTTSPIAKFEICNGPDHADYPVNCVDWHQATAYCAWAGKRLPSEAEWEYAARGTDGRSYPWGSQAPSATRLNACGRECIDRLKGLGEMYGDGELKPMYDATDRWIESAPVGSFPAGASPFGALDLAGNVAEWTADGYGPYATGPATDPQNVAPKAKRVVRGGSWSTMSREDVRVTTRDEVDGTDHSPKIGFRCVRGN